MDPEDQEAENYFAELAGRGRGAPGPAALREALIAQKKVIDEAESATMADLEEAERLKMDGIKRRLEAAGAWKRRDAVRAPPPPSSWFDRARERVGDWTGAGRWQRSVAVAMSVVLASVVVLKLAFPEGDYEDPSRTLRGTQDDVVTANDPEAAARALGTRLQALGADVVLVKISDDEWSMRVDVGDIKVASEVSAALREAGLRGQGASPYTLSVRRRR